MGLTFFHFSWAAVLEVYPLPCATRCPLGYLTAYSVQQIGGVVALAWLEIDYGALVALCTPRMCCINWDGWQVAFALMILLFALQWVLAQRVRCLLLGSAPTVLRRRWVLSGGSVLARRTSGCGRWASCLQELRWRIQTYSACLSLVLPL